MTTTEDRHAAACRCIWCASDPDKTRETPSEPHSVAQEGSSARQARFYPQDQPEKTEPCPVLSLSPSRENPDPFDSPPGPVTVWQCPGCGFVIGIDECCDCR